MATNHSLSYMVFVVSVLSYYVGGSNAPHPVHIYVIFDARIPLEMLLSRIGMWYCLAIFQD